MLPPVSNVARLQGLLAALMFLAALLLGGGQGTLGDTFCQMLALVLIGLALFRHRRDPAAGLPRIAWLAAIPLALPLLQLLPLPGFLWNAGAAREAIAAQLASVGVEHDPRLSLVPLATERALFWLLPGVALFLSALQWRRPAQLRLLLVFVVVALLSVFLGMAQLTAGEDNGLRFYAITNPTSAVGLFANRNHFAIFLVMALPFVIIGTAALANGRRESGEGLALLLIGGVGAVVMLILGVAMAGSRAGLLLGVLAIALSALAVVALRGRRGTRRLLGGVVALGLLLGASFAGVGLGDAEQGDPLEDGRVHYAQVALRAAEAHAPWGTGLGGFRRAYEAEDTDTPLSVYINHAHSDPIELWLEAGWLAPLVLLPLVLAFAAGGLRVWRLRREHAKGAWIRQAAWIALLMVLLHSLVDYPLRTTAHIALAGLLAACIARRGNPSPSLKS